MKPRNKFDLKEWIWERVEGWDWFLPHLEAMNLGISNLCLHEKSEKWVSWFGEMKMMLMREGDKRVWECFLTFYYAGSEKEKGIVLFPKACIPCLMSSLPLYNSNLIPYMSSCFITTTYSYLNFIPTIPLINNAHIN
jgi:hypothetical protein